MNNLSYFLNKLTKKQLCERIEKALDIQDSCGHCEALTIKGILQTGESGLITCEICTNEILGIPEEIGIKAT